MSILGHRFDGPQDGPVVLLLNGGLMTIPVWEPIAGPLAKTFRVLRCDLRGHILSPGRPRPLIDDHVDDVLALLDAVGVASAHVAGVSFGSFVGVKLAARAPERVRSLVLMNSTPRITEAMWRAGLPVIEACRDAAEGRGEGGRMFERLVPVTFSAAFIHDNANTLVTRAQQFSKLPASQFDSFLGIFHALEGLDLGPDLARVRAPTLVIGARGDETFPEPASSDLAAAIPGGRVAFVEGPHGVVVENPQALLEPLSEFLRQQP
jgi:pimeloyl-ACP methyl ester carboxylesterase